jgi:hypothetical protein
VADLVELLYELMAERERASHVVATADTIMPMLSNGKAANARAPMGLGRRGPAVERLRLPLDRGRNEPKYFLRDCRWFRWLMPTADHRQPSTSTIFSMESLSRAVAALLIFLMALTSSAQQVAPLTKEAAAVKRKADTLTSHAPISVIPIHAEEEYGNFVSSNAEEFTLYDIDRKAEVTLKYAEVRKIKDGYGGYNSIRGRHTDPTRAIIVVVAIIGVLGALIGAAAAAKN